MQILKFFFIKKSENHNLVFQLTTLKLVIDAIESNDEDGDVLQNHVLEMIHTIISCFEKRQGSLSSHETEASVNVNSDHGDHIFFDECSILNCNLWPKPTSNVKTYIVQLSAFKNVKIATVAWTCSRYLQQKT